MNKSRGILKKSRNKNEYVRKSIGTKNLTDRKFTQMIVGITGNPHRVSV